MSLIKIIDACEKLTLEELQALQAHLQNQIASRQKGCGPDREVEVVEQKTVGPAYYYLMRLRCGKKNCKCAQGELHGPYWYSYRQEKGKARYKYIGKTLPDDIELLKFSETLRKRAELGRTKSGQAMEKAERARLHSRKILSSSSFERLV